MTLNPNAPSNSPFHARSHVFISHATADDAIISRIHDELEHLTGREMWVDHRDLKPPEHNWRTSIHGALLECGAGLLVLSRNSVNRPEIIAEWTYLLNIKRPLYIAKIDDVPLADIDYRLHVIQWIDLTHDWSAGIQALAASITEGKLPETAPIFQPRTVTGRLDEELTMVQLSGRGDDLQMVRELLKHAPTLLLGIGGSGKSRLAAEIAMTSTYQGVIWHRVTDVSRPYQIIELLKEHFRIKATAAPTEVLAYLQGQNRLVVLDNAEEVANEDARYAEYVQIVNDLHRHGAQVLITSRIEWEGLRPVRRYDLTDLPPDAAKQLVLAMGEALDVPAVIPYAEDIAEAARLHPRLIELAVGQAKRFDPEKVIADLKTLKSKKLQDALDEMVFKVVRRMTETDTNGLVAVVALRRLLVFRNGFTYDAAEAIAVQTIVPTTDSESLYANATRPLSAAFNATLTDSDLLDYALNTLQVWRLIIRNHTRKRYEIPAMIITALYAPNSPTPVVATAYRPHFDYFLSLAQTHTARQDYQGLDVESGNLDGAFEWAMSTGDVESALKLAAVCSSFLGNRGRFVQRLSWFERITALYREQRTATERVDDRLEARLNSAIGKVYAEHPIGDRRELLNRALEAYATARRYFTPQGYPLDYGNILHNTGGVYVTLSMIENRLENLKNAQNAFEEALNYRTPQVSPHEYGISQNNLAIVSTQLSRVDQPERETHIRRAIAAFERAIQYIPSQTMPLYLAQAYANLGTIYMELGYHLSDPGEKIAAYQQAQEVYPQALAHFTAQGAPLEYARVQHNLGYLHYFWSQVEDEREHLAQALILCQEALKYRQPTTQPAAYAMTQTSIGQIYTALAAHQTSDAATYQALAEHAFQEALTYLSTTIPEVYAEALEFYGTLLTQIGGTTNHQKAIEGWHEAENLYRQVGREDLAQRVTARIQNLVPNRT